MRVFVLGSGTSTGVPVPCCECEVCTSTDPKDSRLRTSIYIEFQAKDTAQKNSSEPDSVIAHVLVDTTPDLRYQALRAGLRTIDAVLYTHTHADHVNGIDDLRGFNFAQSASIPIYANRASREHLLKVFPYAFLDDANYEGGAPPRLTDVELRPYEKIDLFGVDILPLALKHGQTDVLGYRINDFAYLTDCSFIPDQTLAALSGLSFLIIDGLRITPHRTHLTQDQAVEYIEKIRPKQAYLTHISHEIRHQEANARLVNMTSIPVELAYDGLVLEL